MPPLKGIDRGLNGEALKALEESGQGRRIAIVDASYNIPRWAQVVDYAGKTSLEALVGILKLVPWEGSILLMLPDEGTEPSQWGKNGPYCDVAVTELDNEFDYPEAHGISRLDGPTINSVTEKKLPGFYSIANDESVDTLFVRTRDEMPYACATFIVGHAQE